MFRFGPKLGLQWETLAKLNNSFSRKCNKKDLFLNSLKLINSAHIMVRIFGKSPNSDFFDQTGRKKVRIYLEKSEFLNFMSILSSEKWLKKKNKLGLELCQAQVWLKVGFRMCLFFWRSKILSLDKVQMKSGWSLDEVRLYSKWSQDKVQMNSWWTQDVVRMNYGWSPDELWMKSGWSLDKVGIKSGLSRD